MLIAEVSDDVGHVGRPEGALPVDDRDWSPGGSRNAFLTTARPINPQPPVTSTPPAIGGVRTTDNLSRDQVQVGIG